MPHYSDHILNPITIQRVSDGSRFYPGVPNTSAPFVYNGNASQLKEMLDSGNYVIVSGASTLKIVTTDLIPQNDVDLELDGRINQFLTQYYTGGSVPSTPTGVSATAGNNQAVITWSASTGATGYNVKRSTTSGSEVTLAAGSNVSGTSFTDTTAANGTLYYYVVSALNANGESANSSEVSATPAVPSIPHVIDTFNRANADAIGLTESGSRAWLNFGSYGPIVSKSIVATNGIGNMVVDSYTNNPTVQATLNVDQIGVAFRITRLGDKYWIAQINGTTLNLYFNTNRTNSTYVNKMQVLNALTSATFPVVMKVVVNGTNFKVYLNGNSTAALDYTDTENLNPNETWVGVGGVGGNSINFTNFDSNSGTTPGTATLPLIMFTGNSITNGAASSTFGNNYASLAMASQTGGASAYEWYNTSHAGQSIFKMLARETGSTDLYAAQSRYSGVKKICVPYELVNCFFESSDNNAIYTAIKNYCLARRAAGFKVIAYTGADAGGGVSNSNISAVNTLIRSNWTTFADVLADVGSEPHLQDHTNTTYFSGDGIHWTDAGHAAAAPYFANAIQTALAL